MGWEEMRTLRQRSGHGMGGDENTEAEVRTWDGRR